MIVPDELDRKLYGQNLVAIYGPRPATRKERHIIDLYYGKQVHSGMVYAKYILERKIGRRLVEPETTDHIDGNPANNDESNLQVLDRTTNTRQPRPRRRASAR